MIAISIAPSAIQQYFMSGDAAKQACAYVRQRSKDAAALRAELTFTFNSAAQLEADIYGHRLCLNTFGGGYVMLSHGRVYSFDDVAQPLAYILATNW
jgi:hypothetical protein